MSTPRSKPPEPRGGRRPGAGQKPGEVVVIRRALVRDGEKARKKLVALMQRAESEEIQFAAAKAILEHVIGRPRQSLEFEDKTPKQNNERTYVELLVKAGKADQVPEALKHLIAEVGASENDEPEQ